MKGYPLKAKRSIYWPVLVIGMSLTWLCSPALAIPRQQVQMGDPDVGDKPRSGPGEASGSPNLIKSSPSAHGTAGVMTWLRILLYLRAIR